MTTPAVTPASMLADAAVTVQQWEARVADIENVLLANAHDREMVEALAPHRDRRARTLDHHRTVLANSIRIYSEATGGVPEQPEADPAKPFLAKITLADDTLGSIAALLKSLLALGITSESITYALAQADGSH